MKCKNLSAIVVAALGLHPACGSRALGQVVQYFITEAGGRDLPAKITFLTPDGKVPKGMDLKSRVPEYASRSNVVYQLYGKGEVPVDPGDYRVYVSRGMEWSIDVQEIRVGKDRPAVLRASLARVVDTTGYVSGDLHLHTKTFSGHGDANVEERLITLCAENVEWAVATDHNSVTDYRPYARRIGTERWMKTAIGNEVTSPQIGHFNTFPLDPALPPVAYRITDARQLFRRIRANPLDEILQLNHPRWVGTGGGYFRELDVSPATGDTPSRRYSPDFDCLEIVNSNGLDGWAMSPPPTEKLPAVDGSVREDWFNLLNRGFRYTGVGNSDSHEVDSTIAGVPRNYLFVGADDPQRVAEKDLLDAIRARRVTVSSGIFVTMTTDRGESMGSSVRSENGGVNLRIRVQAAPWVDADRLVVVGNGEPVHTVDLVQPVPVAAAGGLADPNGISSAGQPSVQPAESNLARAVVRFDGTVRVTPKADAWYVAYAVGDEPPYPIVHRTTIPMGFTNPIWVDADGDGKFTPLREQAAAAVSIPAGAKRFQPGEVTARLQGATPAFRRHAIASLAGRAGADAIPSLAELLGDPDGGVREAAAMALSSRSERSALSALLGARDAARGPWERYVLHREILKAGDTSVLDEIRTALLGEGDLLRFRIRRDLIDLCRSHRITRWWVVGPFPAAGVEPGLAAELPPDREIDYTRRYTGYQDRPIAWRRVATDLSHHLNFRDAFRAREKAVAYASVTVHARLPVRTHLFLQSKNGLDVRLSGRSVHTERARAAKEAAEWVLVPIRFQPGANSLVLKVAVEKGEWGFSLMVIDPAGDLEVTAEGRAERGGGSR